MSKAKDWGPGAWKFLHEITFYYPEDPSVEQQTHALNLFNSLRVLLPCEECRTHYDLDLKSFPPDTKSKTTLSQWLIDLHNRVNIRLGKPIVNPSRSDVCRSNQCASREVSNQQWILGACIGALLLVIALYFLRKKGV